MAGFGVCAMFYVTTCLCAVCACVVHGALVAMAAEDGVAPLPLYFADSSRHFVAGSVSGMMAKIIEYPADTIKVRQQTEPGKFRGSLHCVVDTFQRRGLFGFYKGIGAPLFGATCENAICFGVYSWVSSKLGAPDPRSASMTNVCISGVAAGVVISFWQTPLELVKCRMQSGLTAVKYRGTLHCLLSTLRSEGPRGLFRGQYTTLLREIPGSAFYFVLYEAIVRYRCPDNCPRDSLSIMLAGFVGGAAYWISGYPQDVVKSRQQTGHPGSFLRLMRTIYKTEGSKAFFAGLPLTLLRAGPANAVVFLVYEYALKYLP
ncbi:Mitochondrial carrier protein [Plasmodiophora brassicae]